MTEAEARAMLRDPGVMPEPPGHLTAEEREWMVQQNWLQTGRGWLLGGLREGVRYHVDADPISPLPSLYVVRGRPANGEILQGVFLCRGP